MAVRGFEAYNFERLNLKTECPPITIQKVFGSTHIGAKGISLPRSRPIKNFC